jgi:hypothetical protein
MALAIGLDLDNTLICYDEAFRAVALERGLIPEGFAGGKQKLCAHLQTLPQGETQWQKLQGYVYGAGISSAQLFDGVLAFLARTRSLGAEVFIASHKTQFGHFDETRVDLRRAALGFLKKAKVFDYLQESQVFFGATRAEKIARIAERRCDVFIDDLEEIFADPAFPRPIRKLLFAPAHPDIKGNWEICANWAQIEQKVFDAAAARSTRR